MHKTFFSGLWNGLFKATGLLFSLFALAASLAVMPLQAQTGMYIAPRLPGTQLPDFNGIWQTLNTANWYPSCHNCCFFRRHDKGFCAVPASEIG